MLSDKVCTDSAAQLTDVLFCVHSQGVYGHLIHPKKKKKNRETAMSAVISVSVLICILFIPFCLYLFLSRMNTLHEFQGCSRSPMDMMCISPQGWRLLPPLSDNGGWADVWIWRDVPRADGPVSAYSFQSVCPADAVHRWPTYSFPL